MGKGAQNLKPDGADAGALDLDTVMAADRVVNHEGKALDEQTVVFKGHPAAVTPIFSGSADGAGAVEDSDNSNVSNNDQSSQNNLDPNAGGAGGEAGGAGGEAGGAGGEAGGAGGDAGGAGGDAGGAGGDAGGAGGDAGGAGGDAGGAGGAGGDAGGAKSFRFKSHDEAEVGYKHVQQKLGQTQAELKALQDKLAQQDADAAAATAAAEARADYDRKLAELTKKESQKVFQAIDKLDPDADDHAEQVAELWAQKDVVLGQFIHDHMPAAPTGAAVDGGGGADVSAGADTGADVSGGGAVDGGVDAGGKHPNWVVAEGLAAEAGLDPGDPVFQYYGNTVDGYDADGKPRQLEEVVEEAIEKTKQYHAKTREKFDAEQARAAEVVANKNAAANLPLGNSAAAPPGGGGGDTRPPKPMGIDGALSAANQERRI